MARELIIKIKCDKCKTELTESEVHTGEVTFEGKTYSLDLCEGDFLELIGIAVPKAKALTEASKQAKIVTTPHGEKNMPCRHHCSGQDHPLGNELSYPVCHSGDVRALALDAVGFVDDDQVRVIPPDTIEDDIGQ